MSSHVLKKYIVVSIFLVLNGLLFGCAPAQSDAPASTPVTPKTSDSKQIPDEKSKDTQQSASKNMDTSGIKVYTEEYPPLNFTNEQGKLDGIATKKVQKALDSLKWDVSIEVGPWKRILEETKNGENIFLYSIARTKERESTFKWVAPLVEGNTVVYALVDRAITINSVEDMNNYLASGVDGYPYIEYLKNKGLKVAEHLELTSSDALNIKKLFEKRVDLMVGDAVQLEYLAKKQGLDVAQMKKVYSIDELNYQNYIATGLNTPDDVVEAFRKALKE